MNKEIKEILEYLKSDNWEIGNGDYEKSLYKKDNNLLLDYITNLQQENYELNRMCELYGKSLYYAELKDYKSRCEKAIKYIDTNFCIENRRDLKEVVNILQNGDKSND